MEYYFTGRLACVWSREDGLQVGGVWNVNQCRDVPRGVGSRKPEIKDVGTADRAVS
jgi:hypothetical protein